MSSETINSTETTAAPTAPVEASFTIDGKDYKRSDLSPQCFNSIVVRQDLQATKVKLTLGNIIAKGIPGNPPPVSTSKTEVPSLKNKNFAIERECKT